MKKIGPVILAIVFIIITGCSQSNSQPAQLAQRSNNQKNTTTVSSVQLKQTENSKITQSNLKTTTQKDTVSKHSGKITTKPSIQSIKTVTHSVYISTPLYPNKLNWTVRNLSYNLNAITYNRHTYVTVGESGMIRISNDGLKWSKIEAGIQDDLNDVIWIKNRFIAIGNKGLILVSSDAKHWENTHSGILKPLLHIVSGNGTLVVSSPHDVYFSKDGLHWFHAKDLIGENREFGHIYFSNHHFTIVDLKNNAVFKSNNGENWEKVHTNLPKGRFYTDDKNWVVPVFNDNDTEAWVYTSKDDLTWRKSVLQHFKELSYPESSEITSFKSTSNGYMAFGITGGSMTYPFAIISKDNGMTWKITSIDNIYAMNIADFLWDGNKYISVGKLGVIMKSQDGVHWEVVEQETPEMFINISKISSHQYALLDYNNAYFYNSDNDQLTYLKFQKSNDENLPAQFFKTKNGYQIILYRGPYDCNTFKNGGIVESEEGIEWKVYWYKNFPFSPRNYDWDGKQFVAVGYGYKNKKDFSGIGISHDGINYQQVFQTEHDLKKIKYINGKYISVGEQGTIITADKDLKWKIQDSDTKEGLNDIVWTGKQYVAVGDHGTVDISLDGINWNALQFKNQVDLVGITWNGKRFLAYGEKEANYNYRGNESVKNLFTSTDGRKWYEISHDDTLKITKFIVDGQRFVGIGKQKFIELSFNEN